jgi:hypothetical protein
LHFLLLFLLLFVLVNFSSSSTSNFYQKINDIFWAKFNHSKRALLNVRYPQMGEGGGTFYSRKASQSLRVIKKKKTGEVSGLEKNNPLNKQNPHEKFSPAFCQGILTQSDPWQQGQGVLPTPMVDDGW